MNARALATKLRGAKCSGTQWSAFCPAHNDGQRPALSFCDSGNKVLLKCHAGCTPADVLQACGLDLRDLFHDDTKQGSRRIVAEYDYTNLDGELLYQVVRYDPKHFAQRRPDGVGGWEWKLNGGRRVPFRLQCLAGHSKIINAEGEKDVLTLWNLGIPATCNAGGAGKWSDDLTEQLGEIGVQEVIILPDNDQPGMKHAEVVARSCQKAGMVVRLVMLPGLPPVKAKHGEDVTDWLKAGHTPDELRAAIQSAPVYPVPEETTSNTKPELDCDSGDLDDLTKRAWHLITAHNAPPTLFLRGTLCVRIEVERNRAFFNELTESRCRHEMARIIRCTKTRFTPFGGGGRGECQPPAGLVSNLLATPIHEIPLPPVRGITEIPVVSPNGVLVQTPGYDAGSQLIYRPYANSPITIPMTPSSEEVTAARATIDDLLIDFPFAAQADRCHAIALMLLPYVRTFIDGPTPLCLVEAPTAGTGKGLLVHVCLYPSVGQNVGTIADTRDEDEMRKRITARLLEGCPVTLIDNLARPLDSGVLAAAITAPMWDDRRLGKTETVRAPVETVWVVTANNPTMSMEIARRSIRIRLDPRVDQPWTRDGWRHPQLMDYVQSGRSALVTACLTLIQDWLCAGQPAPRVKPLGSFERWTRVVGGILQHAGYIGFLENAPDFYAEADSDGAVWRTFTELWWSAHQAQAVSVKDLFVITTELEGLSLGKSATERGHRTALGSQLKKRRDQVIGPYRIEVAGKSHNAQMWRLRQVGDRTPSSVPPETEEVIHVD